MKLSLLSLVAPFITSNLIDVVDAQSPPCPPVPELQDIVDTPEKCACFYGLVGSGLDLANAETFPGTIPDEAIQTFAQTGTYIGLEAIAEYLSFVKGGRFVNDMLPVGEQIVLSMNTVTSAAGMQCIATTAQVNRFLYNSEFTRRNVDIVTDAVAGSLISYGLTGDPVTPITVQSINIWLPDELMSLSLPEIVNTKPSENFFCDVLINECGKDISKKDCKKMYRDLPDVNVIDGLTYLDGDTKGCRIFHSAFAAQNKDHCPHITFEAEADSKGFVKCAGNGGNIKLTDLFGGPVATAQIIGAFTAVGNLYGLNNGINTTFTPAEKSAKSPKGTKASKTPKASKTSKWS
mmetsp:Transcript_12899/g.18414  ORF Transcript_12899/g.18414 Transcript_12899/m.18414 type:complete len:348 (-) Transcript_12899:418-1461(-)